MKRKKGSNQFIKGTAKPLTIEQRQKRSDNSKNRIWTKEQREKNSIAMKAAVLKYPESYNSGNRDRIKQYEIEDVKLHGTWEVLFYKWCKTKNVKCIKNKTGFQYEFEGTRTYFPDFYLPDHYCYVEVKGYKTEKDLAKWNQFKTKLLIIKTKEIKSIINDSFVLNLQNP